MNFNAVYDSGCVRRFHTLPDYSNIPAQTTAQHAWGVALIVCEIYRLRDAVPTPGLLRYALVHDAEESQTGDIPGNAKWRWPNLARELTIAEQFVREDLGLPEADLSEEENLILKWADALELYAHASRKTKEGARAYGPVVNNIYHFIKHELAELPEGLVLLTELSKNDQGK